MPAILPTRRSKRLLQRRLGPNTNFDPFACAGSFKRAGTCPRAGIATSDRTVALARCLGRFRAVQTCLDKRPSAGSLQALEPMACPTGRSFDDGVQLRRNPYCGHRGYHWRCACPLADQDQIVNNAHTRSSPRQCCLPAVRIMLRRDSSAQTRLTVITSRALAIRSAGVSNERFSVRGTCLMGTAMPV
jgi:hypothetical protein